MLRITVDVFSGRQSPTWQLTDDETSGLIGRLFEDADVFTQEDAYPLLGYRGLHLASAEAGFLAQVGLPEDLWIANGRSLNERAGADLARNIVALAPVEPRFDGDVAISPIDARTIVADLGEFPRAVDHFLSGPPPNADRTPPAPGDAASDGGGCVFDHLPYDPDRWNRDRRIRRQNNCYAYACNLQLADFPQPGRGSGWGVLRSSDCVAGRVDQAATSDGLIPESGCTSSDRPTYRAALVVRPGVDYHWYRQSDSMLWSHKPGSTRATDRDSSGALIVDPQTCDRGRYSEFLGYFCVPAPTITIR